MGIESERFFEAGSSRSASSPGWVHSGAMAKQRMRMMLWIARTEGRFDQSDSSSAARPA